MSLSSEPLTQASSVTAEGEVTAVVEKLVQGGKSLSRLESGQVLLFDGAIPGETVSLAIKTSKKTGAATTLLKVLSPSAERITPACSVFEACGGCQWQYMTVTTQRHWKREMLMETLKRLGNLDESLAKLTVPALIGEEGLAYRNRVRWVVRYEDGQTILGYHPEKSRDIVSFEECSVLPAPLNQAVEALRQHLPKEGWFCDIQARISGDGNILMTLFGSHLPKKKKLTAFIAGMQAALPTLTGIHWEPDNPEAVLDKPSQQAQALFGKSYLMETLRGEGVPETTLKVSATSFYQVNPAVHQQMMEALAAWLPSEGGMLLDLYAGVGGYGIAFASRFRQVWLAEGHPQAVQDAQDNIAGNTSSQHIQTLPGAVEQVLKTIPTQLDYDVVLLNPPRAGCATSVIEWLCQNKVGEVYYISCDPATLARDLKALVAGGFTLQAIQPFDMFPQTPHIETLVKLQRSQPTDLNNPQSAE